MAEKQVRSISEMIDDDELMTEAIRQGVREELLSHARAGNPVPVSETAKSSGGPRKKSIDDSVTPFLQAPTCQPSRSLPDRNPADSSAPVGRLSAKSQAQPELFA